LPAHHLRENVSFLQRIKVVIQRLGNRIFPFIAGTTFAFLLLYDGLSNELKEFWPDIRRKLFHKKTP